MATRASIDDNPTLRENFIALRILEDHPEIKEAFDLFDKDKNGYINARELRLLLRTLGQNPTDQELMDYLNEVDNDGNGRIDFREFAKMMTKRLENNNTDQEDIREAFRAFDTDRDGYVKVGEMRMVLRNIASNLSLEEIDELLVDADKDHTGKISFEEFASIMNIHKM